MKQWKQHLVLKYGKLYIIMKVINCYLERDNDEVFELHINNSSFIEISAASW